MYKLKTEQKINKEKGQVVLMVLLASALILTLGLSASKVTTTETKIDTDQELLRKAFNTAESGIDYYLATGTTNFESSSGDAAAEVKLTDLGNSTTLSFNSVTLPGIKEYFWLVNHEEDGKIGSAYYSDSSPTVDICSSNKSIANYKMDYFYLVGSTYGVSRTVVSTEGDGCIKNLDISAGGRKSLLLTMMPIDLASSGKLEIRGRAAFPLQGEQISATGKVGGVNNTVTVLNRYEPFLTEAVISGGKVTSVK